MQVRSEGLGKVGGELRDRPFDPRIGQGIGDRPPQGRRPGQIAHHREAAELVPPRRGRRHLADGTARWGRRQRPSPPLRPPPPPAAGRAGPTGPAGAGSASTRAASPTPSSRPTTSAAASIRRRDGPAGLVGRTAGATDSTSTCRSVAEARRSCPARALAAVMACRGSGCRTVMVMLPVSGIDRGVYPLLQPARVLTEPIGHLGDGGRRRDVGGVPGRRDPDEVGARVAPGDDGHDRRSLVLEGLAPRRRTFAPATKQRVRPSRDEPPAPANRVEEVLRHG